MAPTRRLTPGFTASRRERRRLLLGLAFIAPWLAGFLGLTAYPLLASLYYSFTRYNLLQPPRWVGLANYRHMLLQDDYLWTSLANTAFMFLELPLALVLGLTTALLLNQRLRGLAFFRTLFYLPYVLPSVSVALLWLWMLNPEYGLLNRLLAAAGIIGPGWLQSTVWAKPSFILMDLWGVGGGTIIFLAALQGIPSDLYEAAELDGAGPWHRLRHVTLPMLTPTIFFLLVTGVIAIFQYFTQTYITTKGGPENASLFYALYMYLNAFEHFRMGYACAMAWVLFLLSLAATWLIFRTSRRWVYYEAGGAAP